MLNVEGPLNSSRLIKAWPSWYLVLVDLFVCLFVDLFVDLLCLDYRGLAGDLLAIFVTGLEFGSNLEPSDQVMSNLNTQPSHCFDSIYNKIIIIIIVIQR